MAEEKKGGGGWEAFEIVIVLLLAIGLLNQLGHKTSPSTAPSKPSPKKETVSTLPIDDAANPLCGLQIARPHSLEKVTNFVTLNGSVEGCNWFSTDTTALYAQVVDAYGMPLSAYTAVPPVSAESGDTAQFMTSIPLTATPTSSNGFLILIPAATRSSHAVTSRIPLRF